MIISTKTKDENQVFMDAIQIPNKAETIALHCIQCGMYWQLKPSGNGKYVFRSYTGNCKFVEIKFGKARFGEDTGFYPAKSFIGEYIGPI